MVYSCVWDLPHDPDFFFVLAWGFFFLFMVLLVGVHKAEKSGLVILPIFFPLCTSISMETVSPKMNRLLVLTHQYKSDSWTVLKVFCFLCPFFCILTFYEHTK